MEGNTAVVGALVGFAVACPCLPWPGNIADTPRVDLRVDLVVEAGLNFCWFEAIHLCNWLGKKKKVASQSGMEYELVYYHEELEKKEWSILPFKSWEISRELCTHSLHERNDHEEGVGTLPQGLFGGEVLAVSREVFNLEPLDRLQIGKGK